MGTDATITRRQLRRMPCHRSGRSRRTRNTTNSPIFTIAESAVAKAKPVYASGRIKIKDSRIFPASAIAATITGVRVS